MAIFTKMYVARETIKKILTSIGFVYIMFVVCEHE